MEIMSFRGYTSGIHYDDEDKLFFGHLEGIADIVGFHAETREGLKDAFRATTTDYIEAPKKPCFTAVPTPPPPPPRR